MVAVLDRQVVAVLVRRLATVLVRRVMAVLDHKVVAVLDRRVQNRPSRTGDIARTIFRDFKMYGFLFTPFAIFYLSVDFPEIFRVSQKYIASQTHIFQRQ